MNRISSILILIVIFALTSKTVVTAFYPEVLPVSGAVCDWAEESSEEDESEQDDKALQKDSLTALRGATGSQLVVHPASNPESRIREIFAPPPQA